MSNSASLGRSSGRLGVGSGRPSEPGAWRRALSHLRWLAIPLLLALLLLAAAQLDQHPPGRPSAAEPTLPSSQPRAFPPARPDRPQHADSAQSFQPREPEAHPTTAGTGPSPAESGPLEGEGQGSSDGGSGGGESVAGETTSPSPPYQPQTFRHLTVHHLHHLRILWIWNWEVLALVGSGICIFFLGRRRLTPKKRLLLAGLVLTIALGLSAVAAAFAIHQVPGPGTYVAHPVVVADEHENSRGDRFIDLEKPIDHYHPPLRVNVALLLLAAGLMEISVPAGRTLTRAVRERTKRRRAEAAALHAMASNRTPRA